MKQQLALAVTTFSIAAFSPAESQQCQSLQDQVLHPVQNVIRYLEMNPGLDMLAGPGCQYILTQFKKLPQGADLIRQMAGQHVENTTSRCLDPVSSVRYICNDPKLGEDLRCAPQAYTYCGQWEYSMTNQESRYEQAMELAFRLDAAYDKAQAMCGRALRWDRSSEVAGHDLMTYLGGELSDGSQKVYGASCN